MGGGVIRYRDVGTGPVLFFVHGILVNGTLWRHVVANLAGRFRCIVPDLPLGGHSIPMEPGADMTPPGVARMVADLMRGAGSARRYAGRQRHRWGHLPARDLQSSRAHRPARAYQLRRLRGVFSCAFSVPSSHLARLFGSRFVDLLAWTLRARLAQRALVATVSLRHIDDATLDAYMTPLIQDPGVRRDLAAVLDPSV